MQVLIVLAVLGALALADGAVQEPLADPLWRVAATMLAVALPIVAAWGLSRVTVRRLHQNEDTRARILRNYR